MPKSRLRISVWIDCLRSVLVLVTFCCNVAHAQTLQTFRVRVVHNAGEFSARATGWLRTRIERANRIFEPAHVAFEIVESTTATLTGLETRADRHALGSQMRANVINVFVVPSLRDVDDPTVMRQGVHWRPQARPGQHFVIITEASAETTLAHELGHYFGNPHSPVPNNIMSYARDGRVPPFFDEAQIRIIERFAARFVRERVVVRAPPAGLRDRDQQAHLR